MWPTCARSTPPADTPERRERPLDDERTVKELLRACRVVGCGGGVCSLDRTKWDLGLLAFIAQIAFHFIRAAGCSRH